MGVEAAGADRLATHQRQSPNRYLVHALGSFKHRLCAKCRASAMPMHCSGHRSPNYIFPRGVAGMWQIYSAANSVRGAHFRADIGSPAPTPS